MIQDQITLRQVQSEDLPHILEWWRNPSIKKALRVESFDPNIADVEKHFALWREASPEKYVFMVIEHNGEPIGEVGYHFHSDSSNEMQVDIKIGRPKIWRQGIGTRAMRKLTGLIFENYDVSALVAEVGEWNQASHRLFSKCGFVETGRKEIPADKIFDGGTAVIMRLERDRNSHGRMRVRRP